MAESKTSQQRSDEGRHHTPQQAPFFGQAQHARIPLRPAACQQRRQRGQLFGETFLERFIVAPLEGSRIEGVVTGDALRHFGHQPLVLGQDQPGGDSHVTRQQPRTPFAQFVLQPVEHLADLAAGRQAKPDEITAVAAWHAGKIAMALAIARTVRVRQIAALIVIATNRFVTRSAQQAPGLQPMDGRGVFWQRTRRRQQDALRCLGQHLVQPFNEASVLAAGYPQLVVARGEAHLSRLCQQGRPRCIGAIDHVQTGAAQRTQLRR